MTTTRCVLSLLVLSFALAGCHTDQDEPSDLRLPPDPDALAIGDDAGPVLVGRFQGGINPPWSGDLDGMIDRRLVRVAVPVSYITYFIDEEGHQRGIAYEALQKFGKSLNERHSRPGSGIRIVFLPTARDEMEEALSNGRVDLVATGLAITPERLERFGMTMPLASGGREVVVTGPKGPKPTRLEDLTGEEIVVRRSSDAFDSLQRVVEAMNAKGIEPLVVREADEHLEDEDILRLVSDGVLSATVTSADVAALWADIYPGLTVHDDVPIRTNVSVGWMFRSGSPELETALNEFARGHRQGTLFGNVVLRRYLETNPWARRPGPRSERLRTMRDHFVTYGEQYDFDWIMLAAQGYQESGLDQSRRSRAGAIGVMQLLKSTANDPNVGIPDIEDLENNIHAGAKYLRFILDRYFADAELEELDRHLFAFAAYNAGPNRIAKLRKRAADEGYDPNVWFDEVEVVVANNVGWEPVQYVTNIFKNYLAFRLAAEHEALKNRAVDQLGS